MKKQKQNQDNGTDWYVIGNRNSIDVVRNSASVRSVLLRDRFQRSTNPDRKFCNGTTRRSGNRTYQDLTELCNQRTMTAGVGEIANFLIGCSLVVPAALIYHKKHTRTGAVAGMAAGTVFMTVVGCFLNAFVLLRHMPKHSVCRSTAWFGSGNCRKQTISNRP